MVKGDTYVSCTVVLTGVDSEGKSFAYEKVFTGSLEDPLRIEMKQETPTSVEAYSKWANGETIALENTLYLKVSKTVIKPPKRHGDPA